jgi:phosphoribosyl-ATP pyrophosphohydrolase/phosphoribosyl-AMP cyclohydrolase/histidinol dehydrogenase
VILERRSVDAVVRARRTAIDDEAVAVARTVVADVAARGAAAVRDGAARFDGLPDDAPLVWTPAALAEATASVDDATVALLQRVARRIDDFARRQRACVTALEYDVDGVRLAHDVVPVATAGCYAPAGRYPLPSSVLMTVVTARAAGVPTVWVAAPNPDPVMLAAAHVAGASGLLAAGGAHAIAALAEGVDGVPPCDVIVGPGGRWTTAAKHVVSRDARIDMLAGPSELVVIADADADPDLVAADLIAQAEHDPEALPVLVAIGAQTVDAVDAALTRQLADLPTAPIARTALERGFAVEVDTIEAAAAVCDRLAPEHLQLSCADAETVAERFRCYGAVFVGAGAAEVLGDYGVGPNHVLPTGGTARHTSGLSVLTFLRLPTRMSITGDGPPDDVVADAVALARLEGLEGHARAAERRLGVGAEVARSP